MFGGEIGVAGVHAQEHVEQEEFGCVIEIAKVKGEIFNDACFDLKNKFFRQLLLISPNRILLLPKNLLDVQNLFLYIQRCMQGRVHLAKRDYDLH